MPVRISCPECGRVLTLSQHKGIVECDGCDGRFDLGAIRRRPASLARLVVGVILMLTGVRILAVPLLSLLAFFGLASWSVVVYLGFRLFVGAIIFLWGFSLCRGRWVVDRTVIAQDESAAKPKDFLPEL